MDLCLLHAFDAKILVCVDGKMEQWKDLGRPKKRTTQKFVIEIFYCMAVKHGVEDEAVRSCCGYFFTD